jgi:hypothetical protein
MKSSVSEVNQLTLCYYHNTSDRIQNIKVLNSSNCRLERILFPSDRTMFEAEPEDCLKVYAATPDGMICEREIPCMALQVKPVISNLEL